MLPQKLNQLTFTLKPQTILTTFQIRGKKNKQICANDPCPPCPEEPDPHPTLVVAKTCKKCSFWEQEEDNERNCHWEHQVQKPVVEETCEMKMKTVATTKKSCPNKSCTCTQLDVSKDTPECPLPTLECTPKVK